MVQLAVDHRCVQRPVAQHVGYLLDRATLVDDTASQSVAHCMAATMGDSGAPEGVTNDPTDCINTDWLVMWCYAAHEYRRIACLGAFVSQICLQRPSGARWQGQDILSFRLRAFEGYRASKPINIGQLQTIDLDAAQPQVERESDDGVTSVRRRQCRGKGIQ